MLADFFRVNFKGLYQSSGKEKETLLALFTSSTKREIKDSHVAVVQRRPRDVQKSVMHVQSCCLANVNLLLLLPFSLPSPSSLLKLLNNREVGSLVNNGSHTIFDAFCYSGYSISSC